MKKLCLLAFFVPWAGYAQIAYDGLRPESGYSTATGNGGSLGDQALKGPKGWAGRSWAVPGPKSSELFRFSEEATLSFPAITYPGGGGVEIHPPDTAARTRGRALAKTVEFAGRREIYMSFLLQVNAADCGGTAYAAFENAGGNNLGLGAGIHEGNLIVLSRDAKGNRLMNAIATATPQTTYYFIIKLSSRRDDWKGADELEVWVNPADVSSEERMAQTAEFHLQDSGGHNAAVEFGLGRLMLYVENFAGTSVRLDEFALGESFVSVTAPFIEQR